MKKHKEIIAWHPLLGFRQKIQLMLFFLRYNFGTFCLRELRPLFHVTFLRCISPVWLLQTTRVMTIFWVVFAPQRELEKQLSTTMYVTILTDKRFCHISLVYVHIDLTQTIFPFSVCPVIWFITQFPFTEKFQLLPLKVPYFFTETCNLFPCLTLFFPWI